MKKICLFILSGYFSPSGYFLKWETNGKTEDVESPFKGRDEGPYMRLEVSPGDYIFMRNNEVCGDEDEEEEILLIQVPADEEGFKRFKEKGEAAAGESVYNRINGYKHARKGPYDYLEDFGGGWLRDYVIRLFKPSAGEHPENLKEAIMLLKR